MDAIRAACASTAELLVPSSPRRPRGGMPADSAGAPSLCAGASSFAALMVAGLPLLSPLHAEGGDVLFEPAAAAAAPSLGVSSSSAASAFSARPVVPRALRAPGWAGLRLRCRRKSLPESGARSEELGALLWSELPGPAPPDCGEPCPLRCDEAPAASPRVATAATMSRRRMDLASSGIWWMKRTSARS